MKTLVNVTEVEGEGLVGLLGERITVYCASWIYSGKLVGVNDTCIKLEDAEMVFNTGALSTPKWETSEKFPDNGVWYVQTSSIESFGILK